MSGATETRANWKAPGEAVDPRLLVRESVCAAIVDDFRRRLQAAISGARVVIGLVVIWATFYALNHNSHAWKHL